MSDRDGHLDDVQRWLDECEQIESKSEEELNNLSQNWLDDSSLLSSLFVLIENASFHEQYLERICKQLFVLYNTRNYQLRRFVWALLPPIITIQMTVDVRIHNNASSASSSSKLQCTDVLLLAIYNQEVVDEEGFLKQRTFRLPTLSRSSVYHEMRTGSSAFPSSDTFKRPEPVSREAVVSAFGPYPEQDQINLANRNSIICALLKCFHDHLSELPRSVCSSFCRMCNRLLALGTDSFREDRWSSMKLDKIESINLNELMQKSSNRVQFTPSLLLQLLNCLYFCLYNGPLKEARLAVMEIHRKAMANLYSDVLLMTNAILNSLELPPGAKLDDDFMRFSVALSPTSTNSQPASGAGKAAITNASFKTQILPEDIPIVRHLNDDLNAINEESTEDDKRTTDNKESNESSKPTGSSNRNIFSANKEKRKEKKEKKDKEKSHKHHKHSIGGISELNDSIQMNVLQQSGLNLESRSNSNVLSSASLKSPNSASTGNLENVLDQLRLGSANESIKCGSSCVSDRTYNDFDSINDHKGSLSSGVSTENVVNTHPKGK